MPHFVLVSKKIQVYWQQMRPGSHRGFWLAPHKSFSYLLTYVRNIPVHYLHNYINARQTSPYANKSVAPVPHARTSQSGRQLSIIDLFFFPNGDYYRLCEVQPAACACSVYPPVRYFRDNFRPSERQLMPTHNQH